MQKWVILYWIIMACSTLHMLDHFCATSPLPFLYVVSITKFVAHDFHQKTNYVIVVKVYGVIWVPNVRCWYIGSRKWSHHFDTNEGERNNFFLWVLIIVYHLTQGEERPHVGKLEVTCGFVCITSGDRDSQIGWSLQHLLRRFKMKISSSLQHLDVWEMRNNYMNTIENFF